MKKSLFILGISLIFGAKLLGQNTRSSFDIQLGTSYHWIQNILNNKVTYQYGQLGFNYYYKTDSLHFLKLGYYNGGVPDNSGNPIGNYSKLKSSFDRFSASYYKYLSNSRSGSLSLGLGLSYQNAYFQCYNCNILNNFRNDLNATAGLLIEKKITNTLSVIIQAETGYSFIRNQSNENTFIINSPGGGYDVIKNTPSIQLNLNLGVKINIAKPKKKVLPAMDTDQDGVLDSLDRCPGTPLNTKVDSLGCPIPKVIVIKDTIKVEKIVEKIVEKKVAPEISQTIEKKIVDIANEINFVTNKADLLPSSKIKLNELIIILVENPNFNLLISGHTDDVGSEESNLILSQKRTQSVMDYLQSNGISKERMIGLSFGEAQLKVKENTEDARSLNRRVELKVFIK